MKNAPEIQLHPLCTLFPRMDGNEFQELVADIQANGQREPIITVDGMILDGGNRYRACLEAGVKPSFMKFGGGNLVAYVFSVNLHRRHLSPGQQAAIVASAQEWANAQKHGGLRDSGQGARLHFDTADQRAAISGASVRTQKMADKVAKADPELIKEVAQGEKTLPAAVEQITGKRPGAKKKRSSKPMADRHDCEPTEKPEDNGDSMRAEMAEDALEALNSENAYLRNIIAAKLFTGTDEERSEYLKRMEELTLENKRLTRDLNATIKMRDALMRETNELKRQVQGQASTLKKLNGGVRASPNLPN